MDPVLIGWTDASTSWGEEAILIRILRILEQSPLGPPTLMDLHQVGDHEPYDQVKALRFLLSGNEPGIGFTGNGWVGGVKRRPGNNTVGFTPQDDRCPVPALLAYIQLVARCLPAFTQASAGRIFNLVELYREQHLPRPPAIFDLLNWYYLLSPQLYAPCFSKEVLLAAPAYRMSLLAPDWVEMCTYASPKDIALPEGQAYVAAVSRYFAEHRRCW